MCSCSAEARIGPRVFMACRRFNRGFGRHAPGHLSPLRYERRQMSYAILWAVAVVLLLVAVAAAAHTAHRNKAGFRVATTTRPDLIVIFRHCEKVNHVCAGAGTGTRVGAGAGAGASSGKKFPDCCVSASVPPFSCDDCSTQGYLRAQGLPASMKKLLGQIAQGAALTSIYAAGSREMNPKCSHSRRMWEIAVPLAANYNIPINTAYCSPQVKAAAEDILRNNPSGYVAVAWEHTRIDLLAGWLIALSRDPKATRPAPIDKWPGDVFDQYWIVDLRSGSPVFTVAPERILPSDCPYARQPGGACVPPSHVSTWGLGYPHLH
jgi:hypothetical protein